MSVDTVTTDFEQATGPLRPELLAHCYRLLGSATDAEDQVQETYLRAWQAFHSFEGRASVRTWMYRIATNTCLTALDSTKRRPLPSALGVPPADPRGALVERRDIDWMEPLPEAMMWSQAPRSPEDTTLAHEGLGLAYLAALQELPPRQRAVLVLRDVLDFSAAEVAETLDCSVASANSALQRARGKLGEGTRVSGRKVDELDEREQRLFAHFCDSFERYDVDAVVELMAADAVWEMPPFSSWYSGARAIGDLIATHCPAVDPGDLRMVPTVLNGRPAAGMYLRGSDGVHRPFQIDVLDIVEGQIAHVVAFFGDDGFRRAGLPLELAAP